MLTAARDGQHGGKRHNKRAKTQEGGAQEERGGGNSFLDFNIECCDSPVPGCSRRKIEPPISDGYWVRIFLPPEEMTRLIGSKTRY